VWNTGAQGDCADPTAPIRNLFQTLPPLLSTISDQTGISPPSWLAQIQPQPQTDGLVKKQKMVNGANGINGFRDIHDTNGLNGINGFGDSDGQYNRDR